MAEYEIRQLETEAEWLAGFAVLRELRDHLDEEAFLEHMYEMTTDGYRLFARAAEGDIVAVAGVTQDRNMYDGRHVWVYDLVTAAGHRSEGHGLALLEHVEEWAAGRGCDKVVLSSGLERTDAHRFYEERTAFERESYVYKRTL